MKELTYDDLEDLDKLDVIEITGEQYEKIWCWVSSNWHELKERINELKLPFNEFIISYDSVNPSIKTKDLFYFNFKEHLRVISLLKNKLTKENIPMIIWSYNEYSTFEDIRDAFFENQKHSYYVEVTQEFANLYCEYDVMVLKDKIINLTNNDRLMTMAIFFRILVYSQFNQEYIIRRTKTHSKKIQSKKDKRAGKKPKVKLIKQNIIKLNTDHLPMPTEEEIKHYERHMLGWTVRGHWRTYQNGKKVWIKPHIRGDKDNVEGKIYEI